MVGSGAKIFFALVPSAHKRRKPASLDIRGSRSKKRLAMQGAIGACWGFTINLSELVGCMIFGLEVQSIRIKVWGV